MKWNVTNALNRDVERQHLNKILAEIQAAVDGLVFESKKPTDDVRAIVGSMVEGNSEEGVIVTYDPSAGVLDFAVNDFIVRLAGDVTGQATITGLNSATIVTSIDPALLGIPEAPEDNEAYWRRNGMWERVPYGLYELANISGSGFTIHNADEEGEPWLIRQLEVVDGELTLTNPDAIDGNPVFGLADLPDSGVGTSPVQLFTRDSKGRVEGTEDASTDDLPEGVANLYFTEERAQDAVGTILATTDDVALAYDDTTPAISATLPSKGQPDGLATLDSDGKLVATQLPALAITDTFVVADETAMLALAAEQGDVAVRTDEEKSYILTAAPASTLSNWQELLVPTGTGGTVTSVGTGTGLTGGPITSTGTVSLDASSIASLALADSAVQPTRTINTTAPLTGGGNLSANRTLGISAATTSAAGSMSAADKTKLDGIATGATAYTDAAARAAIITSSITDGDTTHSPSADAVYDAGLLKLDKSAVSTFMLTVLDDTTDSAARDTLQAMPLKLTVAGRNLDFTYAAADANTATGKTTGTPRTYTVDASVLTVGAYYYAANYSSVGDITLAAGVGTTMRLTGTATTGNRTVGPFGMARIWVRSSSEVWVDGPGVT